MMRQGKPCVLVDGFRAISLSGAGRSAAPGGTRDLTYHVAWQRLPNESSRASLPPLPLAQLESVAQNALNGVLEIRGHSELEAALCALDDLAAAQLASGLREMGVSARNPLDAATLGVAAPMRPVFERLKAGLVRHDLLRKKGERFEPTTGFAKAARFGRERFCATLSRNIPAICPRLCSARATAPNSARSCAAKRTPCRFCFPAPARSCSINSTATAFSPATGWRRSPRRCRRPRALCRKAADCASSKLAAAPAAWRRRCCRCSSAACTPTLSPMSPRHSSPSALQKLAAFPEVEFKIFDLEKPGAEQDFEAGSFDFIIGTNVLHAVSDVRAACAICMNFSHPGGSLVFMDTATPQFWTESVFGLTSGWWRFTDRDLRPDQPLLERAQWEAVLRESGFFETASLPGLIGPRAAKARSACSRERLAKQRHRSRCRWKRPRKNRGSFSRMPPGWVTHWCRDCVHGRALPRRTARETICRSTEPTAFTLRAEAPEDWRQLLAAMRGRHRSSVSSIFGLSTPRGSRRIRSWAPTHCSTLPGARSRPIPEAKCGSIRSRAEPNRWAVI